MKYERISIPPHIRQEVRQKFGGCCAYCGHTLRKSFHVDHVIPIASGGVDDIANYFPACAKCNAFKSDWSLERFRQELENQIFQHLRFKMALAYNLITIHPAKVEFHFEKQGHKFDQDLVIALMKQQARIL